MIDLKEIGLCKKSGCEEVKFGLTVDNTTLNTYSFQQLIFIQWFTDMILAKKYEVIQ